MYASARFEGVGASVAAGGIDRALVDQLLAAHEARGREELRRLLVALEAAQRDPEASRRLRELLRGLLELVGA